MKTYLSQVLVIVLLVTAIFGLTGAVVSAQNMTLSQMVELLINAGMITADKAVAARALVANLNPTPAKATTPTTPVSLASRPYLQVLSPNGGESWNIDLGLPYSITWGTFNQIPVTVSLVPTSKKEACNLNFLPIISKSTTNTFSVLLKTARCFNLQTGLSTPLTAGTYRARVSYTDGTGTVVSDDSNTTFKILPKAVPSIKVTYPNGGENLIRHTDYDVKYTLKNVTSSRDGLVYLYLLDSNGNTAYNSHKTMRNGTYDMELPSSLVAGAYKVKLKLTTNLREEIEDVSDDFFWISTGL